MESTPVVQAAYTEPAPLPTPRPVAAPGGGGGPVKAGSVPPPPPDEPAPIPGSPTSTGGPLGLDEVLVSVDQHYPLLRAVEQERVLAGGRLVTAMGAFDFNMTAGADGTGPATYDSFRSNLGVNQLFPGGGVGVFAGYRQGYGEFPTYNLGQKTADGGEFRAGAVVPLLQNREIDRPRAQVMQARLDTRIAEPVIERQRIDFHRAAARVYWAWVAAGQRKRFADELVELAADRDEQLKARIKEGYTANVERIDNQQNLALRYGVQVQARRAFQQATIDLSLFLRDQAGRPTLAGMDRLPPDFPRVEPIDPKEFDRALQTAFELRPEPRRLRLQREKAVVDLRLAQNQILPTLNAGLGGSQDAGPGKSSLSGPNGLDRSNLNASLLFALPVQRREARGRAIQAQAQVNQIEQQLRQAEDVVRAEVQDAFSALEAAAAFYEQARVRVELAATVARAERELLKLGRSDVLRVTLREQATFDAEIIEVGAQQDYFRTVAEWRAALGLVGTVPAPVGPAKPEAAPDPRPVP